MPFTGDAVTAVEPAARRIVLRPDLFGGSSCRIDVFTLFPEWFDWMRRPRHLANAALSAGLELRAFNPRDTTPLPHGQVDDSPYGGGPGMVLRVDVMAAALEAVYGGPAERVREGRRVVVLTPRGRPLTDAVARELAAERGPDAALRPLRGLRRARPHRPRQRRDQPRPVRARGRRGGGDGRHRRRRAPHAGRPRQRREPGGRVLLRGARRRPRAPPLHPARPSSAAAACRTSSSPATTAPSPAGGPSG